MKAERTPDLEAVGNLVRTSMAPVVDRLQGMLIAECFDANHQPHTDEAKANARLFAAAPLMLAELTEIFWWAKREQVPLRPQEINSIERVILAATGESHG